MNNTNSVKCPQCFIEFKDSTSYCRHVAKNKCKVTPCTGSVKPDLEVKPQEEENRVWNVIQQSKPSFGQVLKICQNKGIAIPNLTPLFFPVGSKIPPIYSHIGCIHNSYNFLQKAAFDGPVRLKKNLIIKLGNGLIKISSNLIPNSPYELKRRGLSVIDKNDHVIVYHSSCVPNVSNQYRYWYQYHHQYQNPDQ